jgi:ribonucleoside-diphosphate reductase alpha chain
MSSKNDPIVESSPNDTDIHGLPWPKISEYIWENKYRNKSGDINIADTWTRIANSLAANPDESAMFIDILSNFKFLPGGRIISNAGTGRTGTTMYNCYVMGSIPDSMEGIFQTVKEAALTQKQGGGVGFDFSTIRPCGTAIKGVDSPASGPISFMHVLDATCRTIMSAGQRRGAQMGVMRCDHPDIEAFIDAKKDHQALRMFNLSVAVTDAFMDAIERDADWDLVFNNEVYKTIKAKDLWDKIMRNTYDYAEPGVLFIDQINKLNNLNYREVIATTNPCGEQPLPPYGACLLGSINLTQFIYYAFTDEVEFDMIIMRKTVAEAVRMLNRVIEKATFPLPEQYKETMNKRRMGIGITGLADALIMLKLRYGSDEAAAWLSKVMRELTIAAYETSVNIVREIGVFPCFDPELYTESEFINKILPAKLVQDIKEYGIANSHLVSIAPTGTISMLANNVSSGIEPVFSFTYDRKILTGDESHSETHEVMDYAYALYCQMFGKPESLADLPDYFVTADQITPAEHIKMQAAAQKYVDSAVSKTINIPTDFPYEDFINVYRDAFNAGLKGCTTFRPNENIMGVLTKKEDKPKTEGTDKSEGKVEPAKIGVGNRPLELDGTTYKIKPPVSKNAFYVTINNVTENGKTRPYEVFVNTKNLQHYSWVVAITRLISAVLRREEDPSFLIEELTNIHDPNGGYYNNGQYIPSLPAEIGKVIETHLKKLNYGSNKSLVEQVSEALDTTITYAETNMDSDPCPSCGAIGMVRSEGCLTCNKCGFSKCGG